jgi:hypothetical protein
LREYRRFEEVLQLGIEPAKQRTLSAGHWNRAAMYCCASLSLDVPLQHSPRNALMLFRRCLSGDAMATRLCEEALCDAGSA